MDKKSALTFIRELAKSIELKISAKEDLAFWAGTQNVINLRAIAEAIEKGNWEK